MKLGRTIITNGFQRFKKNFKESASTNARKFFTRTHTFLNDIGYPLLFVFAVYTYSAVCLYSIIAGIEAMFTHFPLPFWEEMHPFNHPWLLWYYGLGIIPIMFLSYDEIVRGLKEGKKWPF